MSPDLRLGLVGFGLIAVCYGLARFAFGLFLPQVDAELSLGPTLAGIISGGSFLGYCLALVAAAALTERAGPRAVALVAALVAAAGMAGIAFAPNALWLAAAVLLAGASTGLASPPMAAAVAIAVRPVHRDTINTVINAGAGAGVALSGPVALAIGGQWRLAFGLFAIVALLIAAATAWVVPSARSGARPMPGRPAAPGGALTRLVAACFLTGAASTTIWSFGAQLATLRLGWGPAEIGLLWIALGTAGMAGAFAGILVARFGIDRTHRGFLAVMAAGIVAAGSAFATPLTTLVGGALFGAAYVMLTGIYLVWGVAAMSHRPAMGLTVGFLALAIGQTAGAPIFGLLLAQAGPDIAVLTFAATGLTAGLITANRPSGS